MRADGFLSTKKMGNTKIMKVYNKELSIQVTLSGFSFYIDTPSMQSSTEVDSYDFDSSLSESYSLSSVVEWSLPSALVIPYEIFDHRSIDNYLLSAAMLDPLKQRSIFAVKGDYVVVWSVDRELYDYLNERLTNAEHSHSLLRLLQYKTPAPSVVIEIDNTPVMHIVVNGVYGPEAAHSVRINGTEDIIFYIKTLLDERQITSPSIVFTSELDNLSLELLSQYYPNIQLLSY